RETISGQATELDALGAEVAALAQALGLEQRRSADLTTRLGELDATLGDARTQISQQEALIQSLRGERDAGLAALDAATTRITAFEAQVAALLSERDAALGTVAELEAEQGRLLSEQEALNLALAQARTEIDAGTEAARLAAARREALEALIADLRSEQAETQAQAQALSGQVDALQTQLSEEEAARLAEAAAAEALRARLQNADSELTAMTLALEEQRARAEETLTLLAAAEAAREDLQAQLGAQMTEAEREAALLAQAQRLLAEEQDKSTEAQRAQALLNQQVAALRNQLGQLQALLDDSKERESAASIQVQSLGSDLNAALARAAAEERRRRQLEEAERQRLEAEAQDLQKYRSEFFGRLRDVLGNQPGVQVVGDRFVFASEVLFPPGSADLSPAGRGEVAKVAEILRAVVDDIPAGIDWVIQVDGHTDNVPLSGQGEFADNWELSQGRALSVVRYMSSSLGIPPDRLSANGFGEYNPVNTADTEEARAQNRRIELKFTEK
ncbi:MAG: peptidoglycan -binding protein, partial [Paracoccaceae bacterium]|nr:peptidoglycan -binding protein [Paracoccaceae bacterium]